MSNNNNPFLEYNLAQNAYSSFDAVSLKQLIIDRLNTTNLFTDQNYEGSNLNSVIDIIACSFHVLLFYLNQTSSESTFNQVSLYENMNKIVSVLGYKPTGRQTSTLVYSAQAAGTLDPGTYTIKRFSKISVGGIVFTSLDDIVFEKTTTDTETIFSNNQFLYQGDVVEYGPYSATGEDFETIFISFENFVDTDSQRFVSDNTFRIFIKEIYTDTWYEWTETESLFTADGSSRSFEKRLNEFGRFELKFGNNVNGRKLQSGDEIVIYFVYSNGSSGVISSGKINGLTFRSFLSNKFLEISSDIYPSDLNTLSDQQLLSITVNNLYASSPITSEETVEEMRKNVPLFVSSQNRAVTLNDYNLYVTKNLNGVLASNSILNNTDYVNTFLPYFYRIGLKAPTDDTNVLLNQVSFMTSSNFANIYVFGVPKIGGVAEDNTPIYLTAAQKQLIINELDKIKMTTQTVIPMDPVYQMFDIGIQSSSSLNVNDISNSYILAIRDFNSKQSKEKLKIDISNIILNYFDVKQTKIGQVVSLLDISKEILQLQGIKQLYTVKIIDGNITQNTPGLSFIYWNPAYPSQDINVTSQNGALTKFQYPLLNQSTPIINKIIVQDE